MQVVGFFYLQHPPVRLRQKALRFHQINHQPKTNKIKYYV